MNNKRPVSPHITIYNFQITSTLSFFHRLTGALLSISICLFVFLVKLVTFNIGTYYIFAINNYINSLSNWIVISFLFIILLSLYYHLYNGIRHLFWDKGTGLEIKEIYSSGYLVLILSILSTLATWMIILN